MYTTSFLKIFTGGIEILKITVELTWNGPEAWWDSDAHHLESSAVASLLQNLFSWQTSASIK